jgi:hypothetical protein
VTADTYRTEEVSGENDGRKAGAIDQDVSSMPKPADDDEERMGVPDDEVDDVDALRREVLSVAEAATRGDEIAAVSAMVTSAETAAVREAMAADVPDAAQDDHDDDRAQMNTNNRNLLPRWARTPSRRRSARDAGSTSRPWTSARRTCGAR